MTKLIAILHDGFFDGDSSFYVSTTVGDNVLEYNNETFEELRKKYFESVVKQEEAEIDLNNETEVNQFMEDFGYGIPKGAWIIDEKGIELLNIVTDVDCGNDSASYQANRTAKRVAEYVAVKCLGEKAGDDLGEDGEVNEE